MTHGKMLAVMALAFAGTAAENRMSGTQEGSCDTFMCLGAEKVNGRCVRADGESCTIPCGGTNSADDCILSLSKAGFGTGLSLPAGLEINPDPSAPSSGTKATRIIEGMKGFTDMDDSRFSNFPPTMIGRWGQVPTVRTEAGYEMHMDCVTGYGGEGKMCDHFVMVYSCPPCQYEDGGNIQAILLADGFTPYRCGTVMDLDVNVDSHLHNLVIYHKLAAEGETDVVKAPKLMEFTFFAYSPATANCASYGDEDSCWNTLPGECAWQNGECQRHLCKKPHKPRGPWPVQNRCRVCPHDPSEDRFIPAIKK